VRRNKKATAVPVVANFTWYWHGRNDQFQILVSNQQTKLFTSSLCMKLITIPTKKIRMPEYI
jgi:hypothetical protein